MQRDAVIAVPKPGEEIARRVVPCDLSHITRIEPVDGETKSMQQD